MTQLLFRMTCLQLKHIETQCECSVGRNILRTKKPQGFHNYVLYIPSLASQSCSLSFGAWFPISRDLGDIVYLSEWPLLYREQMGHFMWHLCMRLIKNRTLTGVCGCPAAQHTGPSEWSVRIRSKWWGKRRDLFRWNRKWLYKPCSHREGWCLRHAECTVFLLTQWGMSVFLAWTWVSTNKVQLKFIRFFTTAHT